MPRANRRRRDPAPPPTTGRARVSTEAYAGHDWHVRRVSGIPAEGAPRAYLCPGCSQDIAPGTPHVVVWPAEGVGGLDDRRHWHTACWSARNRRHARGSFR